jgi:hypothetical protein
MPNANGLMHAMYHGAELTEFANEVSAEFANPNLSIILHSFQLFLIIVLILNLKSAENLNFPVGIIIIK